MRPIVYLAGPILGASYEESTDWRERAAGMLKTHNIVAASPMRQKGFLRGAAAIGDCYNQDVLSTQRAITTRDRHDVETCDLLLANLDGAGRASIGTMIELGWADMLRKPIVVVMGEGNVHWHGMVREVASFIVGDLEAAVGIAASILWPLGERS